MEGPLTEAADAALQAQWRALTQELSCDDRLAFGEAKTLAQIISGAAFLILSFWLIFANTAKLAVAQKANLEQRMNVAMTINTAVCLFSGFFNIMQLTKIQEVALPRPTQFTVDLARPVEWVLTCPILQLSLVILGGSRIPSYRRYMMPALSVAVLLCGTASMFTESLLRWVWYGFGCILVLILFYHNLQQVRENSDGAESIWRGSSDFRILSILLIGLWFPFPLWFMVSPEGLGLVRDVTTINMGWVVLNITAKFAFIIYFQFAKSRVSRRKDATRELYAVQSEPAALPDRAEAWPAMEAPFDGALFPAYGAPPQRPQVSEKLAMVATEAMVCLGLSQHTDRFLSVLAENNVTSFDSLEKLNQERCMDLGIPWNLVQATQRRWVGEKMELADELDAEDGALAVPVPAPEPRSLPGRPAGPAYGWGVAGPMSGMVTPAYPSVTEERLKAMEDQLQRLLDRVESSRDAILAKMPTTAPEPKMEPAEFVHVGERLAMMMQKTEASREELSRQIERAKDDVVGALGKELRAVASQVESSRGEVVEQLRRGADAARDELAEKLATCKVDLLARVSASEEHLMQRVVLVGQSVELSKEVFLQRSSSQEGSALKLDALKQDLLAQVDAVSLQVIEKVAAAMEQSQLIREQVAEAVRAAQAQLQGSIDSAKGELLQKARASEVGQEAGRREAEAKLGLLLGKVDGCQEAMARSQGESDSRLASFLTKIQSDTERQQRTFAERLAELLDKLLHAQQDHMIDIRRMNMMVMENVNAAQERAQASIDAVALRMRPSTLQRDGSRLGHGGSRQDDDAVSEHASVARSYGGGDLGSHYSNHD